MTQNEELKQNISQDQQYITQLTNQNEDLKDQIYDKEQQITSLINKNQYLKKKRNNKSQQIRLTNLENQNQSLKEQVNNKQQQITNLTNVNQNLNYNICNKQYQITNLTNQNYNLKLQIYNYKKEQINIQTKETEWYKLSENFMYNVLIRLFIAIVIQIYCLIQACKIIQKHTLFSCNYEFNTYWFKVAGANAIVWILDILLVHREYDQKLMKLKKKKQ